MSSIKVVQNFRLACRCSKMASVVTGSVAEIKAPKLKAWKSGSLELTYLPHKAVAEVSRDKEPIGRECAEFNWFESQLMSDSSEVRFK